LESREGRGDPSIEAQLDLLPSFRLPTPSISFSTSSGIRDRSVHIISPLLFLLSRPNGAWSRAGGAVTGSFIGGRRLLSSSLCLFAIVPHPKRVLCVAEKPSIAREIARILGNGKAKSVSALDPQRMAVGEVEDGVKGKGASSIDSDQLLSASFPLQTETASKYIRNWTFDYSVSDSSPSVHFTVTSVLGHLSSDDFPSPKFDWNKCLPIHLFDAEIIRDVGKVGFTLYLCH